MRYDVTIKDLLSNGAPALLRQIIDVPVIAFLPTEFTDVRRRQPDALARLADGRLFHLEIQASPESRMHWRMFEYYGMISERHGDAEVIQQVLVVGGSGGAMRNAIDHPNLAFRYGVVDIRSLDPDPLLDSPAVEDNLLAVLCRCDDMRQRVRDVLRRLGALPSKERADAVVRLFELAGLRRAEPIVMEEVEAMPITIDLMENQFFAKHILKWRAEGMAEGKAEGKAEGRAEGKASLVLRLLEKRFGPVPEERVRQIRAADADQIDLWAERILDAGDLDAVFEQPSH